MQPKLAGATVVAAIAVGALAWTVGLGQAGPAGREGGEEVVATGGGDVTVTTSTEGGEQRYERVLLRTTEAGIAVRLYDDGEGAFVVEVSSEAAVDLARVAQPEGPPVDQLDLVAAGAFGLAEGAPATWVLVRTEAPVRVTLAEGGTDAMTPGSGYALLAAPGAPRGVVQALAADGSVVAEEDVTGAEGTTSPPVPPVPPEGSVEVLPPDVDVFPVPPPTTTTVPGPTGPPPADPGAAEVAVRDAFRQAFTGGEGKFEAGRAAVVDGDAPEVIAAQRTVVANFPEATRTSTVEVSDVRFLDADTASVGYELTYTGGALFGPQRGEAELDGDTWKVARPTYCTVLGWGGGTC